VLQGAVGLFDQLKSIEKLSFEKDTTKFQMAQAGFGLGQSVSGFAGMLGAQQGAGGLLAGIGGAIGAASQIPGMDIAGGIIGAAVEMLPIFQEGGDETIGTIRDTFGKISVEFKKADEGLSGPVESFIDTWTSTTQAIVASFGGTITDFADLGIKIRQEGDETFFRIRDVMGNTIREFTDESEALAFAVSQLLQQSEISGLSDFMQQAISGLDADNIEELQNTLRILGEVDIALSAQPVTQVSEAFRSLTVEAVDVKNALNDVGASMDAYIAWENKRIQAIKDGVEAARQSIVGFPDISGAITQFADEAAALESELDKVAKSRQAQAEELLQVAEAAEQNAQSQQRLLGTVHDVGMGFRMLDGEMERGFEGMVNFGGAAHTARKEYEDFVASMGEMPEALDPKAVTEAINSGAAQGGLTFINTINGLAEKGLIKLTSEEQLKLRQQALQLEQIIAIAQLNSAQAQFEAILALEQVSGAARDSIVSLLADIPGLIEQIGSASFQVGGGGSGRRAGGGRRQERQREQEEAQKRLEEFNATLQRLSLNSTTAARDLGDLAATLSDISAEAVEAATAGASAVDLFRFQQLRLRELARETTDPFTSFGREGFRAESVSIEQQRRAAIERARLIAEAQSEALGVSFDVLCDRMVEDINAGAARMERALVRSLIDSLGLPLEAARGEAMDFAKQMKSLDQALASGAITGRRYRQLIDQIQAAQAQALGGDVLALVDEFYGEIGGGEEFRRQLVMANFEIELQTLRLRYEALVAENALAEEAMARIGGFLDFMESNPPDWDSYFDGVQENIDEVSRGGRGGRGGGAGAGAATATTGLSQLLDSIRSFIDGFNAIDLGPFSQMANDFLSSISTFESDLDQELGTVLAGFTVEDRAEKIVRQVFGSAIQLEDLTREQLEQLAALDISGIPGFAAGMEDIFDVLLGLEDAEALKPQAIANILDAYEGTTEASSALQAELDAINSEFLDVINALEMMEAGSDALTRAQEEHQRRLEEFYESALEGVRSLGDEIRGGAFGGVSGRERVRLARENFEELRARAEAGDLSAVEQLRAAMDELIAAEQAFTGGAGPEFNRILAELMAFSDEFDIPIPDPEPLPADPALLSNTEMQTELLTTSADLLDLQLSKQEDANAILLNLFGQLQTMTTNATQAAGDAREVGLATVDAIRDIDLTTTQRGSANE
jgi:hypothetical protein